MQQIHSAARATPLSTAVEPLAARDNGKIQTPILQIAYLAH
jgi:hypothetical protein